MVDNTTEPTPIENNPPVPTPPQEETPKITREVKTEKVKDSRREESGLINYLLRQRLHQLYGLSRN